MKTKINYPKSLTEVWEWKEQAHSKYQNIEEIIKNSEENSIKTIKRLGLKRISNQIIDFSDSK